MVELFIAVTDVSITIGATRAAIILTLGINFITPHFYQANAGHDYTNLVRHSAGIVTAWFAEVSGEKLEIKLG